MRMIKPALAILSLAIASCYPPPPVPPPRFKPNPPYPPEIVDDSVPQGTTETPPFDPQPTRPGEYPVARPTANPNEVISPYAPYNVIDVEGFHSGQLARDPSNQQIFRVP